MKTLESLLVCGYYESNDGPTIMLVSKAESTLKTFRNVIAGLASGEIQQVFLEQQHDVKLIDLASFELSADDSRDESCSQSIWITHNEGQEQAVAKWVKSPRRWHDTLMLVEKLIDSAGNRHQYLQEPTSDNVIIELSYKEKGVGPPDGDS